MRSILLSAASFLAAATSILARFEAETACGARFEADTACGAISEISESVSPHRAAALAEAISGAESSEAETASGAEAETAEAASRDIS